MNIIYLGKQEFELLKSTEIDRIEFQKKTFVRDIDVSQRAHSQVVNALQNQGDNSVACLMVEMEGYYTLWREVEISQTVAVEPTQADSALGEATVAQPLNQRMRQGVSRGVAAEALEITAVSAQPLPNSTVQLDAAETHNQKTLVTLITKVVQEAVEQALEENRHIVPEHLIAVLKTEIATLAQETPITLEELIQALKTELPSLKVASNLAQKVLSDLATSDLSLVTPTPTDTAQRPSEDPSATQQRKYRGVTYTVNSEENRSTSQTPDPNPTQPSDQSSEKKRRYRGSSY